MTTREMHYDFKAKFNKRDSQQNRNFHVQEIDWLLNEGQDIFIKAIAEPRNRPNLGFEVGQRTIDDIRTIVVDQRDSNNCISCTSADNENFVYIAPIPSNYMYYIPGGSVLATEGTCTARLKARVVQHDDEHEESFFDRSSFKWRECNIEFNEDGIAVFSDRSFVPNHLCISYIRKPLYIHNAQDVSGSTYTLPDNVTVLVGTQPCELPESTHRQIVDLAVLVATGEINPAEFQLKQAKFKLSE